MSNGAPAPLLSPDGRFEVRVEEYYERASPTITTHVFDRAAGEEIFWCDGAPAAEFTAEGMLVIRYAGYEPNGIVIDPAARCFRTHESEPWVPLSAWRLVESAYTRGWSAAFQFRQSETEANGVWVEATLFFGALAAVLVVLRFGTGLRPESRIVLLAVCAIAVFFFAWLWLQALRYRAAQRKRSPQSR